MRIAYLTIDQVNERLAGDLADACGVSLQSLEPRDPSPDGKYDAVLYDLDSLPASMRDKLLADLLARPAPYQVAVHSYNLEEWQTETLRANGVAVYRRFEPEIIESLRPASDQAGAEAGFEEPPQRPADFRAPARRWQFWPGNSGASRRNAI
jgi:hypothetical protein